MIKVENLGKQYDQNWGIRNLNFEVAAGELLAFIGPNGAGKTTTIKMLTGLLQPTEGRALINGIDIQKNPTEAKRNIGYIPDRPYLYEKLSGRDFMRFVADLFGVSVERRDAMMEKYFELFKLTQAADQLIENYSHGMRQKLIFSATFMHQPNVMVIDEPLVGLDPRSIRIVKNLFREQCDDNHGALFLSTHTLSVAEELADRVGVVNNGKLLFLGTVEELRSETKSSGNLEELFLQLTEEVSDSAPESDVSVA